ncbi:hypothetical protein [Burkholderia cepacia]|uniref:hypothetical protein n=1 Tax=Burkholderia cepacia TaxID=292 RepID=UPI002AB624F7|nr:hypothetical protein [Burkholderia cepacia]
MSRRYFDHPASRRRALFEATLEHDGAWRDPVALKLIARTHNVDESWLAAAAAKVVSEREGHQLECTVDDED